MNPTDSKGTQELKTTTTSDPISQLRQEYDQMEALYNAQKPIVQRFLEQQARQVTDAILHKAAQIRFTLPDQVQCIKPIVEIDRTMQIPPEAREQLAGGVIDRLTGGDSRAALLQRFAELEQNENPAIACSSGLVRFGIARYMIHQMLPEGRSVRYLAVEDEEIPTIPVKEETNLESAITAKTDAIAEEERGERGRGELQIPYVPAARQFFLPQWVAFDEKNQILVGSVSEAEAHIASMQRFLEVLHHAVGLAPYMVVDETYQRKRYGILGQLVNQGRALAFCQIGEIISTIQRRARSDDLNRGLSLSLPYFDDQDLVMKLHSFEVIPAGRIMFVPAFIVRAARLEQAKVAQDTRLSHSTRNYLLKSLQALEQAFSSEDIP